MHFEIFKYVDLKQILYVINFNSMSSSKVFNNFDYVFLSIVLINRINKFIYFKIYIDIMAYYFI